MLILLDKQNNVLSEDHTNITIENLMKILLQAAGDYDSLKIPFLHYI